MIQGFLYGFLMAAQGLPQGPPYDTLRETMADRLVRLIDGEHPVVVDGWFNEMKACWLAYVLTEEERFRVRYRELANRQIFRFWTSNGNGAYSIHGINDWSAMHLAVLDLIMLANLARLTGEEELLADYEEGLHAGTKRLAWNRPCIWPLSAGAFGGAEWPLTTTDAIEEALWVLREFPAPRMRYAIDHTMQSHWCISPYPALPWKFDWMENPGRMQGLFGYPLFETTMGGYLFKDNRFVFTSGEQGTESAGVDYLHAYWMGRYAEVIGEDD